MKKLPPPYKSIAKGLAVIFVFIVFAYGFSVTNVNFEEARSERRLESLTRILRALAKPKILEYTYESLDVEIPFYLGCPPAGVTAPQADQSEAYIVVESGCAEPKEKILVEGFKFQPNSSGTINFVGFSSEAPSGVPISIGNFQADTQGKFSVEVKLPSRQITDIPQALRVTGRTQVGAPKLSVEAKVTWDRIVETVFMALLATAFGTLLAVPISFLSARNLMNEVKSPLGAIALLLIGWIVGVWLGVRTSRALTEILSGNSPPFLFVLIGAILLPLASVFFTRWLLARQSESNESELIARALNTLYTLAATTLSLASLLLIGKLLVSLGVAMLPAKGAPLYFIPKFISQIGDIFMMLTSVIGALAFGGIVGGFLGQIGQTVSDRANVGVGKMFNLIAAPLAFALLAVVIMFGLDWFYQFDSLAIKLYLPAAIGAIIGLMFAAAFSPKRALPIGIVIYGIFRTVLNGTRSIEALVMAIVFVVWIGLGPFAGALALGLHTVASNAKLYSEQVESILTGPLEAIQATGANRLQTIVFAVVPQIIPPYISYTMYRWDINVRMSTIIGFVGGGGIGFILQQNINLLNYRAASVNMLAIAIVVASMDYISSVLREKFV